MLQNHLMLESTAGICYQTANHSASSMKPNIQIADAIPCGLSSLPGSVSTGASQLSLRRGDIVTSRFRRRHSGLGNEWTMVARHHETPGAFELLEQSFVSTRISTAYCRGSCYLTLVTATVICFSKYRQWHVHAYFPPVPSYETRQRLYVVLRPRLSPSWSGFGGLDSSDAEQSPKTGHGGTARAECVAYAEQRKNALSGPLRPAQPTA